MAPVSLWAVRRELALEALLVTIAVCAIAVVLYAGARRLPRWPKGSLWDLRLQSLCAAVAVLILVPAHLHWIGAIG